MNGPIAVEPDEVDFMSYLAEQEAGKVLPVAHWLDEIDDDALPKSYRYPWERLNTRGFAMRMGEMTLWTGAAKHGKTTALNQSLVCAIGQGARVGVISLEFAPRGLARSMRWQSFGLAHGGMTQADRDVWREWTDERLWLYDHHGMQEGVKIAAAAWHMAKNLGIEVIAIDSLMMCGVKSDGDGYATAQTEFVNRLLNIVREIPCHIHLVAHSRKQPDESRAPGIHDVSGSANLVNLPHNVISFWRSKEPEETREYDAILRVVGDRTGGFEGQMKLWWRDNARQYVDGREFPPWRYVK